MLGKARDMEHRGVGVGVGQGYHDAPNLQPRH